MKSATYYGTISTFTKRRSFQAASLAAKEFFGSNMSDNDPTIIEKEKKKTLEGKVNSQIKEAPGWNEKLASVAEASVKADRSADEPIEVLVKETVEQFEKEDSEISIEKK